MVRQIRDIREFQTRLAEIEEGSLFKLEGDQFTERVKLRMKLLREEVDELEEALLNRNYVEALDALTDVDYIAKGTAQEVGILDYLEDGWNLVHANNMTKLDENGKVVKNEYGKIIKPSNYQPVDLTILFDKESELA